MNTRGTVLLVIVVVVLCFAYFDFFRKVDPPISNEQSIEEVVLKLHYELNQKRSSPKSPSELEKGAKLSTARLLKDLEDPPSDQSPSRLYYKAFEMRKTAPKKSREILQLLRRNYPSWKPQMVDARLKDLQIHSKEL